MNQKHAFWQALIITIIIFIIGLIFGFFLESYRSDKLELTLINSEINVLDQQARMNIAQDFNLSCNDLMKNSFNFADKIYSEASKLEKYDDSTKFTKTLFLLHKRYDILRVMLWDEATKTKYICKSNFTIVTYFYEYKIDDINQNSKQGFFSKALGEVKSKNPDSILLIPIAANMEIDSIDLLKNKYNLTSYPVIIVDNKKVIYDFKNVDELEKIILNK